MSTLSTSFDPGCRCLSHRQCHRCPRYRCRCCRRVDVVVDVDMVADVVAGCSRCVDVLDVRAVVATCIVGAVVVTNDRFSVRHRRRRRRRCSSCFVVVVVASSSHHCRPVFGDNRGPLDISRCCRHHKRQTVAVVVVRGRGVVVLSLSSTTPTFRRQSHPTTTICLRLQYSTLTMDMFTLASDKFDG